MNRMRVLSVAERGRRRIETAYAAARRDTKKTSERMVVASISGPERGMGGPAGCWAAGFVEEELPQKPEDEELRAIVARDVSFLGRGYTEPSVTRKGTSRGRRGFG